MKRSPEIDTTAIPRVWDVGKYFSGKQPARRAWLFAVPFAVVLSALHYVIEFSILGADGWYSLRRWLTLNLVLFACLLWIAWVYSESLDGIALFIVGALIVLGALIFALLVQFFWGWGLVGI